jgi:predicted ATP-grasp superfamily ATP-dependent carboligase
MSKRILLTGGVTFAAMDLARLFARQGHEVYLADNAVFPVTRFSKCVKRYIRVPKARFRSREYVAALLSIISEEQINVFIPTYEEIFYVARSADRFPPDCIIWADTFGTLDMLHNKWTFVEHAKSIGLQTPKTEQVYSRQQLVSRLATVSEKVVLKPVYSRFASQTFVWNRGEKLPASIRPTETQPWVLQEFIEGRHLCTYSLVQKGRVLAHCTYPSQQQWGIGSSTVFEYKNDSKVQNWVELFAAQTGFTGQVGFDFIETTSGVLYPIECNPRATSGVHLFNKTPELVGQFLGDPKGGIVFPSGTEVRSAKFWLLVRLIRLIFCNQPVREWKTTWHFLHRSGDVSCEKEDLWPLVGQMISLGESLIKSVRLGILPRDIVTHDCGYNGIDESTEQVSQRNYERTKYSPPIHDMTKR